MIDNIAPRPMLGYEVKYKTKQFINIIDHYNQRDTGQFIQILRS